MRNTKKSKAFTMAEAVLVMTILGIIATIMITTMKPAKFKEKGFEVLGKTIYGEIDTAITQILTDKAPLNQMNSIYKVDNSTTFNMKTTGNGGNFINLLKSYMATARGDVPVTCTNQSYDASMLLKNGACIAVVSGSVATKSQNIETQIPGESSAATSATFSYGILFLDTNGAEEPNTLGKDQWKIPFDKNGIVSGDAIDDTD